MGKKCKFSIIIIFVVFLISIIPNLSEATNISIDKVDKLEVVTTSETTIDLSWTKVNNITAYKVYIFDDSSNSYKYYGKTKNNYITIKDLLNAKVYKIRVRAYKTLNGKQYFGGYSNVVKATTKPGRLKNLVFESSTKNSVNFTWKKLARVTGYKVYVYDNSSKSYIYYGKTKNNSITIDNLSKATIYKVKVRGYITVDDIQYFGKYSNEITAVTRPGNLGNISVKSFTNNSIEIMWNKVKRVTGYKVYVYDSDSKQYNYYGKTQNTYMNINGIGIKEVEKVRVRAYISVDGNNYFGKYSNNMRKSIDVSRWQNDINWKKVKNEGITFSMIRIGYRGCSNGKIYEDAKFKTNIENALAQGIEVGVYLYSAALTKSESIEEANWIIDKLKEYGLQKKCKYISLDFEEYGEHRTKEISKTQTNKNAKVFLSKVKESGYIPVLYANTNYYKNIYDANYIISNVPNCKIWLAQYNTKVTYDGWYDMWQYTSSGSVKGISGNVDLNVTSF